MAYAVIILLSLVSVNGFNFYRESKRCLLYNKTCAPYCPRLMHAYHTRCDADTKSQRTCASPLIYTMGYTCGWSRCDCNGDLVLDEETALCVRMTECPINLGQKRRQFRKPRKEFKLSNKIRLRDYEDPLDNM